MFRFASICLLLAALTVSACGDDPPPTQPTPPPPTGPATLQITDLVVGTGQQAAVPMSVITNYTLWLYDPAGADSKGRRVESSTDPGRSPFPFRLGSNQTIAGYEQGVIGMRVGGKRRVIVPPSLGYGAGGQGTIPGNSWLVFEIDLLAGA